MFKRRYILMEGEGDGAGGGGGGAGPTFVDSVPTDYRDAVTKAGISDLGGLVKNWADTQAMVGNSVRIPGADAGADDIQKFDAKLAAAVPGLVRIPGDDDVEGWKTLHARLGTPEAVGGYKFSPLEGVPPETTAKMDEWFAGLAYKAQLPVKAAAVIRDGWMETVKAAADASQAAAQVEVDKLRGEWGAGFDHRIQLGRQFLINAGEDGRILAEEHLTADRLAAEPLLAKTLAALALRYGEDTIVTGNGGNSGVARSLTEINAEIAEIRGNRDHAYHKADDPRHAAALSKMNGLYELKESLTKAA